MNIQLTQEIREYQQHLTNGHYAKGTIRIYTKSTQEFLQNHYGSTLISKDDLIKTLDQHLKSGIGHCVTAIVGCPEPDDLN